jgi:hypothetical protein
MSKACSNQKKLEAKKHVVQVYSKYVRMGLFFVIFPLTCHNSANEIVEFCTHIANYYRVVSGVTGFLGDVSSVFSDLYTLYTDDEDDSHVESDEHKPEYKSEVKPEAKPGVCFHHHSCDMETTPTKPCNEVCGGHYCIHSSLCDPTRTERKAQSGRPKCDYHNVEYKYPTVVLSPIDEDYEEKVMMTDPVLSSDSSDYSNDSEVMDDGVPSPKTDNEVVLESKIAASQESLNVLLDQQEAAKQRVLRGETHFGLGYSRDYRQPSGVWRRLKEKFSQFCVSMYIMSLSWKQRAFIFCVKYQWWIAGGASMVALAGAVYVIAKFIGGLGKPDPVAKVEGGKKRNKDAKKNKGDLKRARQAVSTSKSLAHGPSSESDVDINWRERALKREEEQRQADREAAEEYERANWEWDHVESKNSAGVKYEDMNRKQLLAEIRTIRSTWFEKTEVDKIKDRRSLLKNLYGVLNTKFPKVSNKTEHFMPGSIPITTPNVYCIRAYKKGVPAFVNGFPYDGCVFVPRHGLSGADNIVLVHGGKEIQLPGKGVVVTSRPDYVMFPLPAGVLPNKNMSFRAPKKGELATLFWVRTQSATKVQQTSGIVGDCVYLGKDRKLCVWEYGATTEDGSCGGIYIAASDGYVIGVQGIGSDKPTAKPLFYPMSPDWREKSKDVANQIPNYKPIDDGAFYDKITNVINNRADLASLNL